MRSATHVVYVVGHLFERLAEWVSPCFSLEETYDNPQTQQLSARHELALLTPLRVDTLRGGGQTHPATPRHATMLRHDRVFP